MVHGSGGGHDQGMAFAELPAQRGIPVIAMSRFGYLRTPILEDASVSARAGHSIETGALLGTRLSPGFGLLGGRTLSLGGAAELDIARVRLRAAGAWGSHAPTFAGQGLLADAGQLRSNAWSLSALVPAFGGRLHAHLAQPLAISGGRFAVGAGYADARAEARETAHEVGFSRGTDRFGQLDLTAYQRVNAGNRPGLSDLGVAVRLSRGF